MAERFFLFRGAYHNDDGGRALPRGAIEVPRLPGLGEYWDEATGAFVENKAIVADASVPEGHIESCHATKAAEAALIASGVTLTKGMLYEESVALGIPIATLAQTVLDRDKARRDAEIARRTLKAQG